MKKIIIIGPAYPLRGGLASFNERLARAFQEAGDDVELHTFSLQYPNFLFPGKTQYSSDPAPKDLKIHVTVNSINPFNWYSVGQRIKKLKPDLVICRFWLPFMGPCLGTILRIIRQNQHTKIISLVDNIIPHEKRIGDRPLTQYFVNSVDGFIVMARAVQEELKQFTTTKPVAYIPHPIYDNYGEHVEKTTARECLKLEPNGQYLLFFGFIRAYKGLDLLLEAMSDKRIQAAGIKAIIAGEYYDDKTKYQAIIDKHQLQNTVIIKDDYIPSEEVRYYFGAADVVVQPYRTATQSGISQLAYHFEKPMIVTRVGGLPEIVAHERSGYVVDVDSKVIADAIIKYYNEQKEAEFTKQVKEDKKRFSWESMVQGFKKLV